MVDAIKAQLQPLLPSLDDPVLDYISGMLSENPVKTPEEAYELLGDHLLAYDAASDEEDARRICQLIVQSCTSEIVIEPSEDQKLLEENQKNIERLQPGANIRALFHGDGMWYDAQIVTVLENQRYVVHFVDYGDEHEVGLAEIKFLTKTVKIADMIGMASGATQAFTDFVLKGVKASWRPDLGVDIKNSEVFYQKTDKQLKKLERERKRQEARDQAAELARQEARAKKKEEVLQIYLRSIANTRSHNKNVEIASFSLSPPDGGTELILNAPLRLYTGRRYGLIGRNGIGKTTLLSAMASYEIRGFPTYLRVLHVEQEVVGTDETVLECVLTADAERHSLLSQEQKLQQQIESKEPGDTKLEELEERLSQIHNRLNEIDAYAAEARAATILNGLGFSSSMQQLPTKALSGGWRMRVALASALFVNPDILLLDEPTNHLDFPAVLWLEDYLQNYPKTLVLVSHDRNFVNNVITDVIHLYNQSLTYYRGDFDTFERVRFEQSKNQRKQFEAQQARREHMQKFIDKFRYNAKRASLVQSRLKALDRMEMLDDVLDDPKFQFSFPECEILQKPIVLVNSLTFGYDPERILLKNIDLRVDINSRIGVVGGNGVGKSTLIKLILGQLNPIEGWVDVNGNARVTCFTQHHVDQLNMKLTPLDYMTHLFPSIPPQEIRRHLGRFGVTGDLATQRIGTLSGGQKSRVAFAIVTFTQPHLIILDEPSNHLDLETVDALIMAINTYTGGILMVSHDQHLLSSCIAEYWAVADQKVRFFDSFESAKKFTVSVMSQPR
eukprot:TRINITY_DN1790_c0_g2_i3.p1 TRINITY_DN1790_c0_g2~~TRINITY_DN1790_c0_g2_i3.p1  ORF type:complete len:785 (-),score=212.31 TRINITY_DN1790_c0_g2_i3:93-2447(-)